MCNRKRGYGSHLDLINFRRSYFELNALKPCTGWPTGADPEKNLTGFQPLYIYRIYMVIFRLIFDLRTFRKVYNFQY